MYRKVSASVVLVALVALVVAASAYAVVARTTVANVTVTAGKPTELKFTVSKKTVPKGAVVFKVTNKGGISHDFKIAGKKTKQLAAGKGATLRVTLGKAGKYQYLCTVPGHAQGGMKGTITVK